MRAHINLSATNLNNDLSKINASMNQWKMTFSPYLSKQTQEVVFSRKTKKTLNPHNPCHVETKKTSHPPLNFNNISVQQVQFQKHLGVYLDDKLDFREHLQNVVQKKINKTISLLHKLENNLPKDPLMIIYKSFVRLHLDYGDILYDQTFNNSFDERLQSVKYNGALAITSAIRGSSREKFYQELGFESLQQRRW